MSMKSSDELSEEDKGILPPVFILNRRHRIEPEEVNNFIIIYTTYKMCF